MTLSTTRTKISYIADGIKTTFPIPFPIFEAINLRCSEVDAQGNETEMTNFVVEGLDSGSGVQARFFTPPQAGVIVVFYRNIRRIQESDYPEGGKFPSTVVESDFDRVVAMIQEVGEETERAFKVSIANDGSVPTAEEYLVRIEGHVNHAWTAARGAENSATAALRDQNLAAASASSASNSEQKAKEWAQNPVGQAVENGLYSAYHWARQAQDYATDGPVATPAKRGYVPSGGAAYQLYGVSPAGDSYVFVNNPIRPGTFKWSMFAPSELPQFEPGWYFMNGNHVDRNSDQGKALNALPVSFKNRWGIVDNGQTVSLPRMFFSDGRAYFIRSADGVNRYVGTVENDQMRPVWGAISNIHHAAPDSADPSFFSGSFWYTHPVHYRSTGQRFDNSAHGIDFNSSRLGFSYSGYDTHPLNVGMTPVLYLGV